MKNKFYLVAFLLLTKVGVGQQSFSLKEAQDYAVEHNQKVLNADIDLKIAEKKVWETTAAGLPQISGDLKFQNFIDIPTSVLPAKAFNPMAPEGELVGIQFGTEYNTTASLQVSQLLFNGNYLVGLQAAKTYTNLSKQMQDKSKQEIRQEIAEAYYTVLVLKENINTLDSTLNKVEDLYRITKILVESKVIESTSESQLRLSLLKVKSAISKVKSQYEVSTSFLKMQMGMDLSSEIVLSETYESITSNAVGNKEEELTVSNNINHQLLSTQLMLNELSYKNTKANYLPSLVAFFSHQQNAQRNDFDLFDGDKKWYPTTVWGLTLNVPIFSSGKRASQVGQAKLEMEKTQNTIDQLSEGLKMQMIQAKASFTIAKQVYETQLEAVEVAKEILESTEIKYKEGVISSMELTQIQNQLLQTQIELTNSSFELIKAKLAIDKLLNKFN